MAARGRTFPLAAAWLAAVLLAAIVAVVVGGARGQVDDDRQRLDEVTEWQATTYVADGTFVTLSRAQQYLPRRWSAAARYRIAVPSDVTVYVQVGTTGTRPPEADDQPRKLQLRVTDDDRRRVVEAADELRPIDELVREARSDLGSAESRRDLTTLVGWALWALVAVGVVALTLVRPGRADRFAGRRVPPEVVAPDRPYDDVRWVQRTQVLPALERDALSHELPAGLVLITVVLGVVSLGVDDLLPAVLVLGTAAIVSAALLIREVRTVELRTSWAVLGQESGMGVAPDTDDRTRARAGRTRLRLAAVGGLALGGLLLLVGLFAAVSLGGGSGAPRMLTLGGLLLVTSGSAVAAGLLQRRESARERVGVTPRANGGTSSPR